MMRGLVLGVLWHMAPALAYRANRQPWRVLIELTPEQYCYLIREGLLEGIDE